MMVDVLDYTVFSCFKFCFPIFPMGAIRYSCPIRLVPTYILPAKKTKTFGWFQPDSFKTQRIVCLETDGKVDIRTWLERRV